MSIESTILFKWHLKDNCVGVQISLPPLVEKQKHHMVFLIGIEHFQGYFHLILYWQINTFKLNLHVYISCQKVCIKIEHTTIFVRFILHFQFKLENLKRLVQ